MDNLTDQPGIKLNTVFNDDFLDTRLLYLHSFGRLPNLHSINNVDGEKALAAFRQKFSHLIRQDYVHSWFQRKTKKYQFYTHVIILFNKCVLLFESTYFEVLHDGQNEKFLDQLTGLVTPYKQKERRKPLEINLVVAKRNTLELKAMEIKRTKLDLDLFYEDDFKEVDEVIRKRLRAKNDKGIVLLHGLPGTGKTTYLRYLVGKIKKRVLFLPPAVAVNLMNPDFIELLVDNPETVLIIEDAENIIMDRKHSSSSSVSNLLNISDGLLADFLNVQIVCTFNNALAMVDSALTRKGRLIARYEFGKLGIAKAKKLSAHLGFDTVIDKPMTIAEIANPNEKDQAAPSVEMIGFRQQGVMMN
jgi:hypothetical protein